MHLFSLVSVFPVQRLHETSKKKKKKNRCIRKTSSEHDTNLPCQVHRVTTCTDHDFPFSLGLEVGGGEEDEGRREEGGYL
ncbi:hypothetical protein E2C01_067498 [Portunus trituberculatus]|uniref:Uncharacterized protein n=1 Tax=Portunus trituberculatus TaxID=210409 RepID=A0A5B7HL60_PORTR|nr:hypothetical protein [Portunus trituberculatus]